MDVPLAAAHFFYHAGWADKLGYAGFGPPPRPLGVVGQVISWSSPLLMLAWQIAPASGLREHRHLEALRGHAADRARVRRDLQAGRPAARGRQRGDRRRRTGQLVAGHPGLDKVAFTGSAEVGKEIAKACALSGKPLTLKLGGTAANIVCADADIEAAAGAIAAGVFVDQGHVCCAGSRVLVEAPVRDELVAAIRRRMSALRLGDPLDANTDVGAVISRTQLDKISELVASGEAEGAQRWSPPCPLPDRGFWFPPTAFTEVADSHRIGRAELAGPVLTVSTFGSPAEAVERAGGTRYGLAAGVWTQRGALAAWLASRLRTGVVWTNTFNRFDPAAPFGGYREAGLRHRRRQARPGGLSRHARRGRCLTSPSAPPTGSASAARSAARRAAARSRCGAPTAGSSPTRRSRPAATSAMRWRPRGRRSPRGRAPAPTTGVSSSTGSPRSSPTTAPGSPTRSAARPAVPAATADAEVDAAVDRWLWYTGWTDKIAQVRGGANAVTGPYVNITVPEPAGVVAVLAPAGQPAARAGQRPRAGDRGG